MAGLYLHIPFCRQACHYCDFHFSTTLQSKEDLLNALCHEIKIRSAEAKDEKISTIYLGGGTPSLLSPVELNKLFDTIHSAYSIDEKAEITLEANPDDLNKDYVQGLRHTPVNRLSIGIQSFRDTDLRFMNRIHTAHEAEHSVLRAAAAGFNNISIDLIYGTPGLSAEQWRANLQKAFALPVQHLSAYCLTVEEGTALAFKVKKGLAAAVNDELAAEQFAILLQLTQDSGMPWYEVSNFARPGFESKHNSAYWKGIPYLGFGPSAHSYSGKVRSWNIASNQGYINAMKQETIFREEEILSETQRMNETVLTRLRTRAGLTATDIRNEAAWQLLLDKAIPHIHHENLTASKELISLTEKGLLFADGIASDLFFP